MWSPTHLAHEAGAALPFVQPAIARAQIALDAAVGERDASSEPGTGLIRSRIDDAHCSLAGGSGSAVLHHGIAPQLDIVCPEVRLQAGLALELLQELRRFRNALPHLRQEGAAVATMLENQAVDTGADVCQRLAFGARRQRFCGRQQGDLDARGGELRLRERLEARIQKSSRFRVGFDIGQQARCACSEPMQPRSRPLRIRVTKLAACSCKNAWPGSVGNTEAEDVADGCARKLDQHFPASCALPLRRSPSPSPVASIRKTRSTHSRPRGYGRPQCRPSCADRTAWSRAPAVRAHLEQAIDRRGAAGLVMIELRLAQQNHASGFLICRAAPGCRSDSATDPS